MKLNFYKLVIKMAGANTARSTILFLFNPQALRAWR